MYFSARWARGFMPRSQRLNEMNRFHALNAFAAHSRLELSHKHGQTLSARVEEWF